MQNVYNKPGTDRIMYCRTLRPLMRLLSKHRPDSVIISRIVDCPTLTVRWNERDQSFMAQFADISILRQWVHARQGLRGVPLDDMGETVICGYAYLQGREEAK